MTYTPVPVRGGHWTPQRKRVIVARVRGGERIDELAELYGLEADEIQAWLDAYEQRGDIGLYVRKGRQQGALK